MNKRDELSRAGLQNILIDSKQIINPDLQNDFLTSENLIIGIHYSDGIVARFHSIIKARVTHKKNTIILHSQSNGISKTYLERSLNKSVNLQKRISDLKSQIERSFEQSSYVEMLSHDRILRYSFIYSDKYIWITFITNTANHEPQIPSFQVCQDSDLYNFFQRDIKSLLSKEVKNA